MKSYKEMIAESRLPERTVPVCLRGDLFADFQALEAELEKARDVSPDSLDDGTGELLERMEAVRALMRENTYPVRLRAMSGPDFRALKAKHPARYDDGELHPDDRGFDFNTETFFAPLLRVSIIDPELVSKDDWEEFVEGITDYQFTELSVTALTLNRGRVDVPFSLAASTMKRSSDDE
jgi:hypothetical protein